MKKTILILLTLAVIAISCIVGTLNVKATKKQAQTDESYTEFEKKYRDEVKDYLNSLGYKNAGVMLTKVINESGKRTYTLEVHHKGFAKLSEESKAEIIDKLVSLADVTQDDDTCVTKKKGEILECKFPVSDMI